MRLARKVEIIPVILAKEFAEVVARVHALEGLASWAQIDVVDGKFAPNVTWDDPLQLASLETSLRFEVDLMVADSADAVARWLHAVPRVGRIYFHVESLASEEEGHRLVEEIHAAGIEAGMSMNPDTGIDALAPFSKKLDAMLCLGVQPGFGGQSLQDTVFAKVRALRERYPEVPIEVDGGVKVGVARKLAQAGVARLAAGSSVFDFDTVPIKEEIAALERDAASF